MVDDCTHSLILDLALWLTLANTNGSDTCYLQAEVVKSTVSFAICIFPSVMRPAEAVPSVVPQNEENMEHGQSQPTTDMSMNEKRISVALSQYYFR